MLTILFVNMLSAVVMTSINIYYNKINVNNLVNI